MDEQHLLLVTLGPVQDFIIAARRTRDLWYGSHLLSELSRAAAKRLAEEDATLIFPALVRGDGELEPCNQPLRETTGEMPLSIANKILAVVPADRAAAELARAARTAAQERLKDLAKHARKQAAGLVVDESADWDEQLATALEFAAAWVPCTHETYPEARRQVEAAVAGRKNLREFGQWGRARDKAPKSSLDGARTTVLVEPAQRPDALVRRFRIGTNEQLDATGVLKRCGGEPDQFTPLRTVALAKWLDAAAARARQALDAVNTACQGIDGLPPLHRRRIRDSNGFRFDADIFFRDRWSRLAKELGAEELPDELQHAIAALLEKVRQPDPYVCCLVADGDRMGKALDKLDQAAHLEFSKALGTFPEAARRIVEAHAGSLAYSGGDDVLAFLPVTEAVRCAEALRLAFLGAMDGYDVTLSVGLGIGHTLTGMGDLLDLGRRAEKLAKKKRNSLAVIVDKRSGGEDSWTAGWDSATATLGEAVRRLTSDELPRGKVAEVRDCLRRSPKPDVAGVGGWPLREEVERILARAEGRAGALHAAGVGLDWPETYGGRRQAVEAWVNLHRVALAFAQAEAALGEK